MRIICDLDSIVFDVMTPWLDEVNRRFGDNLTIADIDSWNWHEKSRGGFKIYDIIAEPGFFRNLKPLDGAIEGVRKLIERGHDVFIVSACDTPFAAAEKVESVREHLPFISNRRLIFAHEKHLLNADCIIDDGPHNAEAYRVVHPDSKILTIGYPYNQGHPAYDVISGDWRDTKAAWEGILWELL